MKILVTGATGLLGQELCPMLEEQKAEGWLYWATNSKIFDITNSKMVNEIMNKVSLDFIIHLAAYTNVDQAEVSSDVAMKVNHKGTQNLAKIAKKFDIPILYVSSDCVFDGKKYAPYEVDDVTGPVNVYGKSKLRGEEEIRKLCKKHYIVRTGWLYGKGGRSFVDTMLTFSSLRDEISIVDDQVGCPTWTKDLAEKIIMLMKSQEPYGTYHICSQGHASWSDFTKKIYEIKKRPTKVTSIKESDFPRPAERPKFCVLSNSYAMPCWEESLEKYLLGTSAPVENMVI